MIRFRLKELIAEKEFQEGRRITYEEITKETGVHRKTLSRIANIKGYVTTTEALDKLCAYFDVNTNEVAEYLPDPQKEDEAPTP